MHRLVAAKVLPKKFECLRLWKALCPSCLFSKQRRRYWRTRSKIKGSLRPPSIKKPGDCVSIDHLISAQPGLIPRLSGKHTQERICAAVIFKDHFSDFSYCHLMTACNLEETIAAKRAFEKHASTYGVSIKHYHADNGHFACQGFRDEVSFSGQRISFCGVGAHHQNGVVENQIGLLTCWARTSLLHAKRYWPEMISTILWPYALKSACQRYNELHFNKNGLSPEQRFSGSIHKPMVGNRHPWGCPVFVMTDSARENKSPK